MFQEGALRQGSEQQEGVGRPSEIPYKYSPSGAQGLNTSIPSPDQRGHLVHLAPLHPPHHCQAPRPVDSNQGSGEDSLSPKRQVTSGSGMAWGGGEGGQCMAGLPHDLPVEFLSVSSFGT